jgi:predicted RNA-binding protein with PIN domain
VSLRDLDNIWATIDSAVGLMEAMVLTARMMIALFRREDADLSYLQQALATVYARKGEQADAYLEKVLTKVSNKRATVVRTLAAQVRAQRSR